MRKALNRLPEIVLGALALGVAAMLVPTVAARMASQSQEEVCRSHLRALYQAIQRYRADHHGDYPRALTEPPALDPMQPPVEALVPRYLRADELRCPADPTRGAKPGWGVRFSYIYGLDELRSPSLLVRKKVQSGLIDRFGPGLYLAICPSFHRGGPVGLLTLHADGGIYKEFIGVDDPQERFRRSLWKLEAAAVAHRSKGHQAGAGLPRGGGALAPPASLH